MVCALATWDGRIQCVAIVVTAPILIFMLLVNRKLKKWFALISTLLSPLNFDLGSAHA
jgi:hypothetical protein